MNIDIINFYKKYIQKFSVYEPRVEFSSNYSFQESIDRLAAATKPPNIKYMFYRKDKEHITLVGEVTKDSVTLRCTTAGSGYWGRARFYGKFLDSNDGVVLVGKYAMGPAAIFFAYVQIAVFSLLILIIAIALIAQLFIALVNMDFDLSKFAGFLMFFGLVLISWPLAKVAEMIFEFMGVGPKSDIAWISKMIKNTLE